MKTYLEIYESLLTSTYDEVKKDADLYAGFIRYVSHCMNFFQFWTSEGCGSCEKNKLAEIKRMSPERAKFVDTINLRDWRLHNKYMEKIFYVCGGQIPRIGFFLSDSEAKELYFSGGLMDADLKQTPLSWITEKSEIFHVEHIVKTTTKRK